MTQFRSENIFSILRILFEYGLRENQTNNGNLSHERLILSACFIVRLSDSMIIQSDPMTNAK